MLGIMASEIFHNLLSSPPDSSWSLCTYSQIYLPPSLRSATSLFKIFYDFLLGIGSNPLPASLVPQDLAHPKLLALFLSMNLWPEPDICLCCPPPSNSFLFCLFSKPWLDSHLLQKHSLVTLALPSAHLWIPSVQWFSDWLHLGFPWGVLKILKAESAQGYSWVVWVPDWALGVLEPSRWFERAGKFQNHPLKSFGLIVLHVGELLEGTSKIRFPGCTSRNSNICVFFFFRSPGDFDLQCDFGLCTSLMFFHIPQGAMCRGGA